MICKILPAPCQKDCVLPLLPAPVSSIIGHIHDSGAWPTGVGWELLESGEPLFSVCGRSWLPTAQGAILAPLLLARRQIANPAVACQLRKSGHALAVITLSDKGSQGLRTDTAGPLCARLVTEALPVAFSQNFILPDDAGTLRGLMADLALTQKYDLICTCGGTGLGPRDITPQVTASLLDYPLPGFGEAMRATSLAKTPNAIISRAICGALGSCLVINLPGSAKAVAENLAAILPGLNHALAKLQGDSQDCGG